MDANDMILLNDIYIRILKKGRDVYKESEQENTISNAQKLESYSTYLEQLNIKIENILELNNKYARECITKATEIRKFIDLNDKYKDDPSRMILAHREMYGDISWGDLTDLDDKKKNILKTVKNVIQTPISKKDYIQTPIMYKDLSQIYNKDIGFNCKIPIINKLNEMPSALYWYEGDQKNPKGVYTCISRKFYVQVPLPNVIDGTKDFNRTCSIKCKYNTVEECFSIRDELAKRYDSEIRECKFAHHGDKYTKIGTSFRCPNIPRFGNHLTLSNDLDNLPDYDIKMMLMYSLSDILLANLWFQKQKDADILFTNIDTC